MAAVPTEGNEGRSSERAPDATARLRVLARVSVAFAEVVTDYHRLIETIARTTADLVGDGCAVTLVDEAGETMFNAASAHRDPALEVDYRTYLAGMAVSTRTSASISAAVARTGQAKLVSDVRPQDLVAKADPELQPIVARLNVHSFVVVPIRARKAIIGTLSIMRSGPGRNYTPDDLMLLEDLASRAGLAIDNARLFRELEQRVRERTAELEIANAELEAFSYSVAHDLRAPLRAIDGFGQALLDDCGDQLDDVGRKHLARIREGARRMAHLIDDLLGLARIGRMELRRQEVDVSALAHSLFDRLRQEHPARSVLTVVEPGLVAHADPSLLEIVLTNLLGNAWKFTGKRASARIELARASGGPAVFVVRDDGAGFDPAHAKKLFGVFQRLHTPREFEGTGIGLAIVERIVTRHGGRVWAEGAPDQGASFFFTLEP